MDLNEIIVLYSAGELSGYEVKERINALGITHTESGRAAENASLWTLHDELPSTVPDRSLLHGEVLSLFQKILLTTDGTVTDLISLYKGETIKVDIIDQEIVFADAPAYLQCGREALLLKRIVLLKGPSGSHVYAESIFVIERLSENIRERLLETNLPIGLLWKEERLESYREILTYYIEREDKVSALLGQPAGSDLLSRTYLIHNKQSVLGAITEKFPFTSFR